MLHIPTLSLDPVMSFPALSPLQFKIRFRVSACIRLKFYCSCSSFMTRMRLPMSDTGTLLLRAFVHCLRRVPFQLGPNAPYGTPCPFHSTHGPCRRTAPTCPPWRCSRHLGGQPAMAGGPSPAFLLLGTKHLFQRPQPLLGH